jgi:hypothetical protein
MVRISNYTQSCPICVPLTGVFELGSHRAPRAKAVAPAVVTSGCQTPTVWPIAVSSSPTTHYPQTRSRGRAPMQRPTSKQRKPRLSQPRAIQANRSRRPGLSRFRWAGTNRCKSKGRSPSTSRRTRLSHGHGRAYSCQSAGIHSPPAIVESASKIFGITDSLTQRTEPSAIATWAREECDPPNCRFGPM